MLNPTVKQVVVIRRLYKSRKKNLLSFSLFSGVFNNLGAPGLLRWSPEMSTDASNLTFFGYLSLWRMSGVLWVGSHYVTLFLELDTVLLELDWWRYKTGLRFGLNLDIDMQLNSKVFYIGPYLLFRLFQKYSLVQMV